MATSSVNPTTLLAKPTTTSARPLSAPEGFVDSLDKAIRREDIPATRPERPETTESDSSSKKAEEKTNATAQARTEQDASNADTEAATDARTEESSQGRSTEDEQAPAEAAIDTVIISQQAVQQTAVVLAEVTAEGEAVVQAVDTATTAPSTTGQQLQEAAASLPGPTPGELPTELSPTPETQAVAPATSELASHKNSVPEAAVTTVAQNNANKSKDRVAGTTKEQTQSTSAPDGEPQEGEAANTTAVGRSVVPQDTVPVVPVPSTASETGQDSQPVNQQPTSKVEPSAPIEAPPESPTPEVEGLKLHAEGDLVASESKDRPAPQTSNFSSVLDRATSLASRRTPPTEVASHQMPQVDAQRFVNRVSRAFQVAESRGGPLQLRLSPPELGAMKIELSIQQGTLTAKLETETAAAKSVLMDNLPALRERLAAQEIRIDKFEVDVRQQNSGEQPNWQAQQDGQDARNARGTGRRPSAPSTTESNAAAPAAPVRTHHNGQFSAVA